MFLLKIIRKFGKFVRGGAMPWQVAASFMLGMCLGMTPGFNLTVVALILAFILLNLNLGLMLVGLLIGKTLCLTLAPVTFRIGHFIIHGLGAEGLFSALSQMPLVAWMNLHYYCLIGGIPIALIGGGVLGLLLGRVIVTVRAAVAAGGENSERFGRLSRSILVRFLLRVLFGKQKKTLADMLSHRPPAFRKAGVIVCLVVIVLMGAAELLLADRLAKAGLTRGLEAATGAEVNIESVDFSPLTGTFTVTGLQMTDPDRPKYNMVQIDTLTSDLSVMDLLSRRFVMDEVVIDRLRVDVERASAGEVFIDSEQPDEPIDETTVSKYFAKGEKILNYLRKAKEYMDRREESRQRRDEEASPEDLQRLAELKGYLRLSAQDVIAKRPDVTIRRLVIEAIPAGSVGTLSVEGLELSNSPELNEEPMTLAVTSTQGMDVTIVLDFTEPGALHRLDLFVPDVPVGEGEGIALSADKPVRIKSAKVNVAASGTFSHAAINLPVTLAVSELNANTEGDILGLGKANSRRLFDTLRSASVVLTLTGSVAAPRVKINAAKTLASLKGAAVEGVVREGRRQLEERIGIKLPDSLPKGIPNPFGRKPSN